MNILVTICARKGSKGIKNKNIKELNGEPLIAHTIRTAKKWGKKKKIICSTDSKKIADIAKKYGAETPFIRPIELATDQCGKIPVIRHALMECERIYGKKYEIIVDLDVTNPLRTHKDIDDAFNIFKEKEAEVLFSVVKSRKSPYFNMVEIKGDGFAEIAKKPKNKVLRRQDSPDVYELNASIYFYKRNFLLNPKNMFPLDSEKAAIYMMNNSSAIDIDDEIDFKFIEFLIKRGIVKL